MASKSRLYLCTIGVSMALSACAGLTTSGGEPKILSCKEKSCGVPIGQNFPYANLEVAEKVVVDSPRPVMMTWTLNVGEWWNTRFHPEKGIVFKDPGFDCHIDASNSLVYTCINNALPGEHKYTIKTVGFGAPPERDPFVVNN